MEVIGLPNGTCEKPGHGAKLSVNGEARCIKCVAEAERATRTHIPVVSVEDPGEEAFAPNGMLRAGLKTGDAPSVTQVAIEKNPAKGARQGAGIDGLVAISEALSRLPMPKSLKQYKRLQKIKELIDEAVKED